MITARLATENDIDRIVEIRNTMSGYYDFNPAFVQYKLDSKDWIVAVCEENNKIIGFGFLKIDTSPYQATHFILDSQWNPLIITKKLTAMNAMSLVFLKYAFKEGTDNKTQCSFPTGTHLLFKTAFSSFMPWKKVDTKEGNEIWEVTFTDQKILEDNLALLKE